MGTVAKPILITRNIVMTSQTPKEQVTRTYNKTQADSVFRMDSDSNIHMNGDTQANTTGQKDIISEQAQGCNLSCTTALNFGHMKSNKKSFVCMLNVKDVIMSQNDSPLCDSLCRR